MWVRGGIIAAAGVFWAGLVEQNHSDCTLVAPCPTQVIHNYEFRADVQHTGRQSVGTSALHLFLLVSKGSTAAPVCSLSSGGLHLEEGRDVWVPGVEMCDLRVCVTRHASRS